MVKAAPKGKPYVDPKKVPLKPKLKQVAQIRTEISKFLELNKPQRIAIVADNDPDGMTAAIQLKKFLDKNNQDSIIFFYDHYARTSLRFLDLFVSFNPQKTIFIDVANDLVSECLEAIGRYTQKFLIVDHHKGIDLKNAEFEYMVVKPWDFSTVEPSKYPASKMAFDLFHGEHWLCAIGLIGDSSSEQWPSVMRNAIRNYSVTIEDLTNLSDLIRAVMSQFPEEKQGLFVEFYKAKKPQDVLNSPYMKYKDEFDKRLTTLEMEYTRTHEEVPELDLVFFKGRFKLASTLINKISKQRPGTTFVFFEQPGNHYTVSLRRSDFKVDCGAMAKFAVKGIDSSNGGGHTPAAGATFPSEHYEEFKKRIKEYLKQNYKK
ncbi:MAG: DHH family phosphoesterase [archaeon]